MSFVDDPTRSLRAVRFEKRFDYQIEDRTLELLQRALPLLDRVSGDRLRHELNTILQEEKALDMLERLAQLKVLPAIHPKLKCNKATLKRVALAYKSNPGEEWGLDKYIEGYPLALVLAYVLWLMPLERVDAASVAGRLKLPGWLTKLVLAACLRLGELPELVDGPPSKVVSGLEEVPTLALYAHYLTAKKAAVRQSIAGYIQTWQHVQQVTSGHDLRQRGIPPGPVYRQILDRLRAAWLDGLVGSEAEEKDLLEELLRG